ncbi:MAG: phosphatase PAP2 family protein [Tepidiformaceae bacterium]
MGPSSIALIFDRDVRCRTMLALAGFFGLFALAMTTGMAIDDAPAQYDVTVIHAVQGHSPAQDISTVVNRAGDYWWAVFFVATGMLLAGSRIVGCRVPGWTCRSEAITAFVAALTLLPINAFTKVLVESPRPDAALGIFVDYTRGTYGFPSGHVYNDVLFYGVMAVYAPMWVGPRLVPYVRTAAIGIIFMAGWSRMVVGAHWPSDVLGGYLWGIAALALVVGIATIVGRRFHPQPLQV